MLLRDLNAALDAHAAVSITDADGRMTYVNDAACAVSKFSRGELLGQTHRMVNSGYHSAEFYRELWATITAGKVWRGEIRNRAKDGTLSWAATTIVPFLDAGGHPDHYIAIRADITERKDAEARLRESERHLQSATQAANIGLWDWDLKADTVWLSPEWKRQIGYEDHEVPSGFGEWESRVHPDDQAAAEARLKAYLADPGSRYESEFRLRHRDGSYRWILAQASLIRDAAGEPARLVGSHLDITERKRAEVRLHQLNRIYAMLSDINEAIVRERDPQAILATACRIAVEQGGLRMAWIGMLDAETQIVRPVASAGVVDGYLALMKIDVATPGQDAGPAQRALRSGVHTSSDDIEHDPGFAPWREEALRRGYRSSGAFPLWVAGRIAGVFNLYADEPGFFSEEELRRLDRLAMDIAFALEVAQRESERVQAENELRWKTAFFEAQVGSAQDGILVVNNQGKKLIQNDRMGAMWGIPPEVAASEDDAVQLRFVTGRTVNPQPFVDKIAHLYAHPDEISRDIVELTDGTILDRTSSPVLDKAGHNYGRIWSFRDITEQRKLETLFRQSQKMEAIGQLAGGVAHDFNNILAAIMMQASLAAMAGPLPVETQEMLDEIQAAAERAANLTRQLLAFSRRQVMQPRQLDVNDIVTNLAKMLERITGEDVRLQLRLHPSPLVIRADAGMIDQVLLNLVVNARDAMPRGGELVISTGEARFTERDAASNPDVTPGRYVCLCVTDTGTGIAAEHLPRIFEPFFTTKEPGKGTGLGLATVFGIVKQHGGWIAVESRLGEGATFKVYLPASDASAEPLGDAGAKLEPPGGTETILLVEDDAAVRVLTRAVLERAGYRVFDAANGVEALAVWDRHPGEIQLLFTDIVMPEGMSGRELAVRLHARNPKLCVVYTSGYSADIAGRDLSLEHGQDFVQKPASLEQILITVRRCLDG